jgi:hypothetical protein
VYTYHVSRVNQSPYLFIKLHQLMTNPGVYRGSKDIDISIIWPNCFYVAIDMYTQAIPIINPTIMTTSTIGTTLKYRVFKQKINICLDNYYMYLLKRVWRYQKE